MSEHCPDIEVLAAYVDHSLTPEEREVVEAHLVICRLCRKTVVLTFKSKGAADNSRIQELSEG